MSLLQVTDSLLTRKDVSKILNLSVFTVDRRIQDGELPAHRLGSGTRAPVRIYESEVKKYLDRTKSRSIDEVLAEMMADLSEMIRRGELNG